MNKDYISFNYNDRCKQYILICLYFLKIISLTVLTLFKFYLNNNVKAIFIWYWEYDESQDSDPESFEIH